MTDAQKKEIQHILSLEGWQLIEGLLTADMPDMTEGRFEDIAINTLAKNKARKHIAEVINKIKNLYLAESQPKQSFK